MHRTRVRVVTDALDANETIAQANRADFDRHEVTVVNVMSAPGAGKTSLLEHVVRNLEGVRVGVLEGDVQGTADADRLASLHVPVTQINTDAGFGGECHLDANMVRSALPSIPLEELDLLLIENVGNLICPAEFRVGEDHRVMVSAVTEGEDKPLKYPLMFRACELVVVNKIDLLPHLEFDLDLFLRHLEAVHPGVPHLLVSARTGEGVEDWRRWLAVGGSPQAWSDAHHVAVEFVHPVIVGKRALPALALAPEELGRMVEADDAVVSFEPLRFALGRDEWLFEPPTDDPFVRQELCETLYHVVWELVHVFFEHLGGSEAGGGAAEFLYPFLADRTASLDHVVDDVRQS